MKTNSLVGQAISMIILLAIVFVSPVVVSANEGDLVHDSFTFDTVSFTGTEGDIDIYSLLCQDGAADHCRTTEVWVLSATNDQSRGIEVVENSPVNKTFWMLKLGASTVDSLPSEHYIEIPYFFTDYYETTTISLRYLNYRDEGGDLSISIGATDSEGNIIWENTQPMKNWQDTNKWWVILSLSETQVLALTEGRPFNFVKIIESNITSAAGASYIDEVQISGLVSADPVVVEEMLSGFVPELLEPDAFTDFVYTGTCPEPEIIEVEVIKYVEVIEYVYIDRDNGHGNDEDGYDTSNPGKGSGTKKK